MDLIPALDTYSYHIHADAWEPLPDNPWGIESIVQKASDLNLRGIQSADMKHFLRFHKGSGWDEDAVSSFSALLDERGLLFELGTGGMDEAHMKGVLDLAWLAGARVIRTFLGGGLWKGETETRSVLKKAAGVLLRLAPVLEEKDLQLAIENHQDLAAVDLARFVEQTGSSHVGICLDTGNPLGILENPLDAAGILAPFVKTIHLKDYHVLSRSEGYILVGAEPGAGAVPIAEILRLVKEKASVDVLQVNLECAVEYIPAGPERNGWRPGFSERARKLLDGLGNVDSEAGTEAAQAMERLRASGGLEQALDMEKRMVAKGARRMLQLLDETMSDPT